MLHAQFSTMDGGTDADEGAVDGPGDAIASSTGPRRTGKMQEGVKMLLWEFQGAG
jgi:hypothetical protein